MPQKRRFYSQARNAKDLKILFEVFLSANIEQVAHFWHILHMVYISRLPRILQICQVNGFLGAPTICITEPSQYDVTKQNNFNSACFLIKSYKKNWTEACNVQFQFHVKENNALAVDESRASHALLQFPDHLDWNTLLGFTIDTLDTYRFPHNTLYIFIFHLYVCIFQILLHCWLVGRETRLEAAVDKEANLKCSHCGKCLWAAMCIAGVDTGETTKRPKRLAATVSFGTNSCRRHNNLEPRKLKTLWMPEDQWGGGCAFMWKVGSCKSQQKCIFWFHIAELQTVPLQN